MRITPILFILFALLLLAVPVNGEALGRRFLRATKSGLGMAA